MKRTIAAFIAFVATLGSADASAPGVPVKGKTLISETCSDGRDIEAMISWSSEPGHKGQSAVTALEVSVNGVRIFSTASETAGISQALNRWAAVPSAILRRLSVFCWPDTQGLSVTIGVDRFYTDLKPAEQLLLILPSGGDPELLVRRETSSGAMLLDARKVPPPNELE